MPYQHLEHSDPHWQTTRIGHPSRHKHNSTPRKEASTRSESTWSTRLTWSYYDTLRQQSLREAAVESLAEAQRQVDDATLRFRAKRRARNSM